MLSSLDLAYVLLPDSIVRFVGFLPALQDLFLGSTGISNFGYASLSSPCRTEIRSRFSNSLALPRLVELALAYNSRVDNNSVAAPVASAKIKYLDLVGTRIDVAGARRLTAASRSKESVVILPVVCGKYLSSTLLQNFAL